MIKQEIILRIESSADRSRRIAFLSCSVFNMLFNWLKITNNNAAQNDEMIHSHL